LYLLLLGACSGAVEEDENSRSTHERTVSAPVYQRVGGELLPDPPKLDELQPTGRLSERLFALYTPTDTFFEPYLEVLLSDGRAGWVYARPDYFPQFAQDDRSVWQAENRIQALLGPNRLREYRAYRQVWTQAASGQANPLLVQAYRSAVDFRDELQAILAIYPEQPLTADQWESMLPGTQCHLEEGRPRWWIDYRQWLAAAQAIGDTEAAQLFALYCQAFPQDSIEYYYPVWRIAETPRVQHSLLGRYIHLKFLRALDTMAKFTSLAGIAAADLQQAILEDILRADNTYWEEPAKILAEMDTILLSGKPRLDPALTESLQRRRAAFAGGKARMNVRAGQLAD